MGGEGNFQSHLPFWGILHFLCCLHFWGRPFFRSFSFWGHHHFRGIFIFEVLFIFEVVFIFELLFISFYLIFSPECGIAQNSFPIFASWASWLSEGDRLQRLRSCQYFIASHHLTVTDCNAYACANIPAWLSQLFVYTLYCTVKLR